MIYLEYILWCYFLILPIYVYNTHESDKQRILANPQLKIALYQSSIIFLWVPVLLLLILDNFHLVSTATPNYFSLWNTNNYVALALLILIIGYILLSIYQIDKSDKNHQAIREQLEEIEWMLPSNIKERNYFLFGVSVSAGVCEEILFRGYLLNLFALYVPAWLAILLSSIAFGLPHIYQGLTGVIKTSLVGLIFALVYYFTDSLIYSILLHIAIDVYSGSVAYIVKSKRMAFTDQQIEK